MMHHTATIDISPTPFKARVLSLPIERRLLLDGRRGGGMTYAVNLEVSRRAERWGAQSQTLITRQQQGALSELEHSLVATQEISTMGLEAARRYLCSGGEHDRSRTSHPAR